MSLQVWWMLQKPLCGNQINLATLIQKTDSICSPHAGPSSCSTQHSVCVRSASVFELLCSVWVWGHCAGVNSRCPTSPITEVLKVEWIPCVETDLYSFLSIFVICQTSCVTENRAQTSDGSRISQRRGHQPPRWEGGVNLLLPLAYVVRREGYVLTRVCLSTGGRGVPISHNALQHYPECHGTDTWGGGGYPYPIMLCNITQNSMGQTPGGIPCQRGVPCWGGEVPCPGGVPR